MAKAAEAADNNKVPVIPDGPPKGFTDETRPDIKGWLRPEVGLIVHARIVGYFTFEQTIRGQTRTREVVCLKVYQKTKAAVRGSDQAITLDVGDVMGASMMFCLNAIKPYVERRGQVWIRFTKKESIGNGQFVWKADVHCQGEKAALTTVVAQLPGGGDNNEESEGLPF